MNSKGFLQTVFDKNASIVAGFQAGINADMHSPGAHDVGSIASDLAQLRAVGKAVALMPSVAVCNATMFIAKMTHKPLDTSNFIY